MELDDCKESVKTVQFPNLFLEDALNIDICQDPYHRYVEKHGSFFVPKNCAAPVYRLCHSSSALFTSLEWSSDTKHNLLTGAVRSLEESSHVFLTQYNPV